MIYPNFYTNLAMGRVDLQSDDLRVLLLSAAYVFDPLHDARNDVSGGAVVAESLSGLPNKSLTLTADEALLTSDPITFFAVSGSPITQAILYKRTSNPAQSWLIAHYPTLAGLPFAPTGGNIVLTLGTKVLSIGVEKKLALPPPVIGTVYPPIVDPSGGDVLDITGTNLVGCAWSVGGTAATLLSDTLTTARIQVPAKVEGVYALSCTRGADTGALPAAVEYWDPLSVLPGQTLKFDAEQGVTLGATRLQMLITLPNKRVVPPYVARDGASLHIVTLGGAKRYVQCAGWHNDPVASGWGAGVLTTNEVWSSPDLVTWTPTLAHNNGQYIRRHTHGAFTINNEIILIGGDHWTGVYNMDAVASADGGATWTVRCASLPWTPRALTIYGKLGNDIYAFGGQTGFLGDPDQVYNDMYKSSDGGATWTLVDAGGPAGPTRPAARGTVDFMPEFNGRMWLCGGAVYPQGSLSAAYFADCWSYHPSNGWQQEANPPWTGKRYGSVRVVSGHLVVTSGYNVINTADTYSTPDGITWTEHIPPVQTYNPDRSIPGSHADAIAVDGDSLVWTSGNSTFDYYLTDYRFWIRRMRFIAGPRVTAWTSSGSAVLTANQGTLSASPQAGVQAAIGSRKGIVFDGRNVCYDLASAQVQPAGRTVLWAGVFPYFDMPYFTPDSPISPNETILGDGSSGQFCAAGFQLGSVCYTEGAGSWIKTSRGTDLFSGNGAPGSYAATNSTGGEVKVYKDGVQLGAAASASYAISNSGFKTIGAGFGGNNFAHGYLGAVVVCNGIASDVMIAKFNTWALRYRGL
jgi:hypothetical protein